MNDFSIVLALSINTAGRITLQVCAQSKVHTFLLQDDIYGEARSLYDHITSASDMDSTVQLKNFEAIKPLLSMAGNAAAKLLE